MFETFGKQLIRENGAWKTPVNVRGISGGGGGKETSRTFHRTF
jgi:hypothetical protein